MNRFSYINKFLPFISGLDEIEPGQTWRSKNHVHERIEIVSKGKVNDIIMWSVLLKTNPHLRSHIAMAENDIYDKYILDKTKRIIGE